MTTAIRRSTPSDTFMTLTDAPLTEMIDTLKTVATNYIDDNAKLTTCQRIGYFFSDGWHGETGRKRADNFKQALDKLPANDIDKKLALLKILDEQMHTTSRQFKDLLLNCLTTMPSPAAAYIKDATPEEKTLKAADLALDVHSSATRDSRIEGLKKFIKQHEADELQEMDAKYEARDDIDDETTDVENHAVTAMLHRSSLSKTLLTTHEQQSSPDLSKENCYRLLAQVDGVEEQMLTARAMLMSERIQNLMSALRPTAAAKKDR